MSVGSFKTSGNGRQRLKKLRPVFNYEAKEFFNLYSKRILIFLNKHKQGSVDRQ